MNSYAIGLSVDSLVASFAVAPLVTRTRDRIVLAAAFGVLDGTASSLAGIAGAPRLTLALAIVFASVLYGMLTRGHRRLAAVPLLLSADNLVVPLGVRDSVAAGATSCALSCVGFATAALVYRTVPAKHHRLLIASASIVAVAAIVWD